MDMKQEIEDLKYKLFESLTDIEIMEELNNAIDTNKVDSFYFKYGDKIIENDWLNQYISNRCIVELSFDFELNKKLQLTQLLKKWSYENNNNDFKQALASTLYQHLTKELLSNKNKISTPNLIILYESNMQTYFRVEPKQHGIQNATWNWETDNVLDKFYELKFNTNSTPSNNKLITKQWVKFITNLKPYVDQEFINEFHDELSTSQYYKNKQKEINKLINNTPIKKGNNKSKTF